ncbi:hypothetical protein F2Q69_00053540 [Brassica cretica]|uniref:Response regulatory domain-containing protein n=1 Tax=Brassica cretica TaxID=69181 RepID=A0A8S9MU54_BRACR|nr:hypothetical protein F2Q69_00053540 [Brassica cretica]
MTVEQDFEAVDQFPVGMRVLAVDDDQTCLRILETLLHRCQYHGCSSSQFDKEASRGTAREGLYVLQYGLGQAFRRPQSAWDKPTVTRSMTNPLRYGTGQDG